MIKEFISYRITNIMLYVMSVILLPLITYLYNNTYKVILYYLFVYTTIVFVFFINDYIHFKRKHNTLINQSMNNKIDLPKANHVLEEDYQNIIINLEEDIKELEKQFSDYQDDMDQYYSLWVHQIKTPIAAMQLLIQSDQLDGKLLKQELFKIEQYTTMVLQYIRINSITNDFSFCECVLENIVKQVVKKYASLLIYSNIKMTLKDLDKIVLTDEKWIVFVIEQLISNAAKYSNGGHIVVEAKENQQYTYLNIQDDGMGIRKEDLPRIFERGFTGFNGRIDNKSSGIGLYLVKRIMDHLKHGIMIDSMINKGTKVTIIFSKKRF